MLNTDWIIPASTKEEDALATRRALDLTFGWFLKPLVYGHYPVNMIGILKHHLLKGNLHNRFVIGPTAVTSWLNVYPPGIKEILVYIKEQYKKPIEDSIADSKRVNYYIQYLYHLQQAIKEGFTSGYSVTFGLYHVDMKDGLKRYPKDPSGWFKNFLRST
ncbi:hypothetical protein MKW98_013258 [Papaver atlanticum]|uniref:Beta-glucosidase n=1 Tax=Papaver atlanticum TaxID=357466 RepID=A0AAD4SFV0_9MAGN|nr:hypothetical protein MKW98_013258 [Papaver atlanticum]